MRHRAIPLRRLLAEQPEPEPPQEKAAGFYASFDEPDPQGDEAWRDAVAEHTGPFIPENY